MKLLEYFVSGMVKVVGFFWAIRYVVAIVTVIGIAGTLAREGPYEWDFTIKDPKIRQAEEAIGAIRKNICYPNSERDLSTYRAETYSSHFMDKFSPVGGYFNPDTVYSFQCMESRGIDRDGLYGNDAMVYYNHWQAALFRTAEVEIKSGKSLFCNGNITHVTPAETRMKVKTFAYSATAFIVDGYKNSMAAPCRGFDPKTKTFKGRPNLKGSHRADMAAFCVAKGIVEHNQVANAKGLPHIKVPTVYGTAFMFDAVFEDKESGRKEIWTFVKQERPYIRKALGIEYDTDYKVTAVNRDFCPPYPYSKTGNRFAYRDRIQRLAEKDGNGNPWRLVKDGYLPLEVLNMGDMRINYTPGQDIVTLGEIRDEINTYKSPSYWLRNF